MSTMPKRDIRIPDWLWTALEETGRRLHGEDGRGERSALLRDAAASMVSIWRDAPYICTLASYYFFFNRDGDAFYRAVSNLELNSDRRRLPCRLELKDEKQRYYEQLCEEAHSENLPEAADRLNWLRSRWIFNHFAAWAGDRVDGSAPPLDATADLDGITTKVADLRVDRQVGSRLTRQVLAGLRDYAQWEGDDSASPWDRAGASVDIPTKALEMTLVLDSGIYRHSDFTNRAIPLPKIELRNREAARFGDAESAHLFNLPAPLEPDTACRVSGKRDTGTKAWKVAQWQRDEYLAEVYRHFPSGESGVFDEVRQLTELPKDMLFFHFRWPTPQLGLHISVRWEKPRRGPKSIVLPIAGAGSDRQG